MKKNNVRQNAIAKYSQQVLSGFSDSDKQKDKDGKGDAVRGEITWNETPSFWQQESYTILIPVVIKRTTIRGNEHEYEISIPTNVDVLVSPTGPTSKNLLKQVSSLAKTSKRDNAKISLVSRISSEGSGTLSLTPSGELSATLAYVYSRVLGVIHRTVERMVLQPEKTQGDDDPRDSNKLPQGQKGGVGKH